jgi:hypothetical protein
MTKIEALNYAINAIGNDNSEVATILEKMVAQLSKPRTPASEEAKAKISAARKEKTAEARKELVAKVAPVLRKYLTEELTAKELFAKAQSELPEDFSAAKVQNILLREMAPELVKTEAKGKANTYRLA